MRRTAVAVIGCGCAVGVFAAAGAISASADAVGRNQASSSVASAGVPASAGGPASATEGVPADHGRGTPSRPAQTAAARKLKTVEYDGYPVTVPHSWPVVYLGIDPAQCVRHDANVVYPGNPGTNQNCPSNLIGRAQTVTITAAGVPASPRTQHQQTAVAHGDLGAARPASSAGQRIGSVPAALNTLDQYGQQHEFRAAISHSDVSVKGTYGGDAGQIGSIIPGARKVTGEPSRAGSPAVGTRSSSTPMATPKPAGTLTATWTSASPITLASRHRPRIPSRPVNGFDTCTAPSVRAMRAWKRSYSAIGVYIGGQNMACGYGNLSASWVTSVRSMGWSLLPLYVGLQAPCNRTRGKINKISKRFAASQGRSAANTAVSDARNLRLGRGTPIYFDMESYSNSRKGCRHAVLTFLDAWTRELHVRGYTSGIYSNALSAVTALVAQRAINGHRLAEPDALWFALWDSKRNLKGAPYLPGHRWASDRVKQYAGNRTRKIGGYTLHIDADRVGGAVAGP